MGMRPKTGETWLVEMGDVLTLRKVQLIMRMTKTVEVRPVLDDELLGPSEFVKNEDIEFVEKI